MDRETVITHLQIIHTWAEFACERDLQFFTAKHLEDIAQWADDAIALLKDQEEVEATINEDYEIFCGNCGDNVGIIGRSVNIKICSNYCSCCGKKVKRPKEWYET